MVFILGLLGDREILQMDGCVREAALLGGLGHAGHKAVGTAGIKMPAGLIPGQKRVEVRAATFIGKVEMHLNGPNHILQVGNIARVGAATCGVVKFEVAAQRM